ncbi:chemotaxis protein CheW [Oceanispirochaeta crateris]|uniref:Chemotaxis protein CheW n=1 Tax=Oceanispirochaeta crateris TaxID=2518645 RepID=A0A5C1QKG6_9SPIO|nr:CheR family methyltransferase [Oceanispirochaeta crateris]QEN07510.1 chemotaxis protein CheW [Oceanispirochaeta crateris]
MNTSVQGLNRMANEKEIELAKIDFKMVTFTLAGKDYGIDIMKVKEIHKALKFTFVPNSAPFVKGVYNMRGDIISVIDLRVFFNLPVPKEDKGFENMIILRLEDNTIGILVDTIDKVIGIDSSRKQPPHPLFGDINIKYIDGVVENDSSLYIILDSEKIFNKEEKSDKNEKIRNIAAQAAMPAEVTELEESIANTDNHESLNLGFIKETLPTYLNFFPSGMNEDWISSRFDGWMKVKGEDNFQLKNRQDAEEYLRGFNSSCSGQLWSDDLIANIKPLLPSLKGNAMVWNPGCGRGYETYSLACLLKNKNPEVILKIQGNDNDLINISSAPGLNVDKEKISSFYEPYLVTTSTGAQFNEVIKDSIIFEYSDLSNESSLPPLDMVVCRDTLCYQPVEGQIKLLDYMYECLKPGGLLMLGDNEVPINLSGWEVIANNNLKLFKKI